MVLDADEGGVAEPVDVFLEDLGVDGGGCGVEVLSAAVSSASSASMPCWAQCTRCAWDKGRGAGRPDLCTLFLFLDGGVRTEIRGRWAICALELPAPSRACTSASRSETRAGRG